jgi:transcriptional regulator with XRE-family HTH domain
VSPAHAGRRTSAATGKDELGRALGRQLRRARDNANLSRADVHAATGVSESHIEKIERGDVADPGVFVVAAIARKSGVGLERLIRAAEQEAARAGGPARKTH